MKPKSQPARPPVDLFEGLQAKRRTDGLAPAGLAAQRWLQEVGHPEDTRMWMSRSCLATGLCPGHVVHASLHGHCCVLPHFHIKKAISMVLSPIIPTVLAASYLRGWVNGERCQVYKHGLSWCCYLNLSANGKIMLTATPTAAAGD